jgi:alpha-ketoglutarate-dependent taurine dioxygenase
MSASTCHLEVDPLGQPLGAVVRGMDFTSALDGATIATIKDALRDHLVLVFRGHQSPSDEQLVRFGSMFGELNRNDVAPEQTRPDNPEVLVVSNIVRDGKKVGTAGSGRLDWHTDYSYQERVGLVSFLEAVLLPDAGGSTYYTNLYLAYDELAPDVRQGLEHLSSLHSTSAAANYQTDPEHLVSQAVHPLVVTHPDSGRRTLYVNSLFSKSIIGMDAQEGAALLRKLFDHTTDDRFIYRHDWVIGDLVVWDDVGTLHSRDAFDPSARRYMRAMTTLVPNAIR